MPTNYISISEFRKLGYVHEINRRLLHPVGLALEIRQDEETGEEYIHGVQDYREEAGGICFSAETIDADKAQAVLQEERDRIQERLDICGWWIQPAPKRDE